MGWAARGQPWLVGQSSSFLPSPAQDSIGVEHREVCSRSGRTLRLGPHPQGPHGSGLTLNVAQGELSRLGTWDKSSGKVVTALAPRGERCVDEGRETHRLGPPGLDELGARAAARGARILVPWVQPSPPPPQQEAWVSPYPPPTVLSEPIPGCSSVGCPGPLDSPAPTILPSSGLSSLGGLPCTLSSPPWALVPYSCLAVPLSVTSSGELTCQGSGLLNIPRTALALGPALASHCVLGSQTRPCSSPTAQLLQPLPLRCQNQKPTGAG